MTREFSAGGIIFNSQGQVLLIQNKAVRDPSKIYWGFPKGQIEKGESMKETALREVKEETGITAEIVEKIADSRYVYTRDNQKIFKVTTLFLMKYLSGDLQAQSAEILTAYWEDPSKALEKLSFPNDKQMLQKALNLLASSQN